MPTFRRRPAKTGVQGPGGRRARDRSIAGRSAAQEAAPPGSAAKGEGSAEGQAVAQRIRAELERLHAPRSALRGADIEPMLAETAERAFSRKGWLFELKIDGFRAIASKRGGAVALQYRRGRDAVEVS